MAKITFAGAAALHAFPGESTMLTLKIYNNIAKTIAGIKAQFQVLGNDLGTDAGTVDCGYALGSDAAIEAADVVLMDDDPLKIAKAIRISRKCMRIVHENIWFAIGIKLLVLLLGALGLANMWAAIFADVVVMVLAVLNAIRALFTRKV